MKVYQLSEQNPWEDYPNLFLYFKRDHLKLQTDDFLIYCFGSPDSNGIIFPIHLKSKQAFSPLKGHFGGIQVVGDVQKTKIESFINSVFDDLKTRGVNSIEIKQAANCYSSSNMTINEVLENIGVKRKVVDRNFHIKVTDRLFEDQIHQSEKRKLNKSYAAGVSLQVLGNQGWEGAYELIKMARDEKNTPMSLPFQSLSDLIKKFPNDHLVFMAFHNNELIATSICILSRRDVLYSFLPAHLSAYNHLSPLVILYDFIYDYCFKNGIKTLDLGIATENGVDNAGLIRFKQNLGALETTKSTYFVDI